VEGGAIAFFTLLIFPERGGRKAVVALDGAEQVP
jgi:hypothetical protein